jgi:DNA-binding beta-propeller fold protein YncE
MNSGDGTVAELDTGRMRMIRTMTLKPALEYAVRDGASLFVNNEDRGEIETVDTARGAAGTAIALPGCEGPTGLALDKAHGRLIADCANGKAAIVDIRTRRLVGLVDIGHGPDAVIVDPARKLAFIPCGKDGVLDILSIASADKVERVGRVGTEPGARTGALDPATGVIYLPTARFAPAQPGERPTPIPGTFHILVVRPS